MLPHPSESTAGVSARARGTAAGTGGAGEEEGAGGREVQPRPGCLGNGAPGTAEELGSAAGRVAQEPRQHGGDGEETQGRKAERK